MPALARASKASYNALGLKAGHNANLFFMVSAMPTTLSEQTWNKV